MPHTHTCLHVPHTHTCLHVPHTHTCLHVPDACAGALDYLCVSVCARECMCVCISPLLFALSLSFCLYLSHTNTRPLTDSPPIKAQTINTQIKSQTHFLSLSLSFPVSLTHTRPLADSPFLTPSLPHTLPHFTHPFCLSPSFAPSPPLTLAVPSRY